MWRKPVVLGLAFSVLGAAAYSGLDVTGKMAFENGLNVTTLLSLRFVGAGIAVLILAQALSKERLPQRRVLFRFFALGAFAYALESFLLNSSISRMPVAAVILIFYAYPSIVAVLAFVVNREPLGGVKLVALLLGVLGIAILLGFPMEGMTATGVTLALGAALAFAAYAIVAEKEVREVNPILFSGVVLLGAGVSITLIGSATRSVHVGVALDAAGWVILHMLLIATGVVAFAAAITKLGATRAAIGNTIEPGLTVILAIAFLGERPRVLQLVGGGLLVCAIVLLPRSTRTRELAADLPVHE